ncbi:MAG TPA: Gfo/Idh/MocA family oxidoreductase [Tepidisphaeraceae bacterium]|jgi:predicted dehydrogenase|nr:Gfo/Idh/MocA family oxidoreductase [Tepidisphaeraceae bacterium]
MIHLALVGCGNMAHWHAQQLQKIVRCKVIALVDPVAEQTRQFREKYFHEAAQYDSMENLLAVRPAKLDGVVLVTPHTLHFSQAMMALENGLHVLVEKPMVTRSEHAYELWRAVKKSGKMLGITFQSPYTSEFGYIAAEREAGRLGKVQIISGWLSQHWMKWTKGSWRQDQKLSGGGQMYDSGAHLLNAFMWLMNEPVVEVACFYDCCGAPVDINGAAIVRFAGGAIGSIAIGGNCPAFRTEIQIQTDRFLIVTDQYGGKLEIKTDEKRIYPHVALDDRASAGTPHLNFINAILGGEKLRVPVRYGVLLSALMDALYESADKQRPVKVEPVPDEI